MTLTPLKCIRPKVQASAKLLETRPECSFLVCCDFEFNC